MATRVDPYRGFNFLVEIDGITQAGFQECSGLDSQTGSIDYREGADPNHVRKLSGPEHVHADLAEARHHRLATSCGNGGSPPSTARPSAERLRGAAR